MTGRPAALSALAFASTASVADSEMADTRADILVVGMLPWCHLRLCHHQSVSPAAERPPGGPARGTAVTQGNPHLVRLGSTFGIHSGGCKNRRAVAQLVESRSPKPAVGGSSPSCPASAVWQGPMWPGQPARGGSV